MKKFRNEKNKAPCYKYIYIYHKVVPLKICRCSGSLLIPFQPLSDVQFLNLNIFGLIYCSPLPLKSEELRPQLEWICFTSLKNEDIFQFFLLNIPIPLDSVTGYTPWQVQVQFGRNQRKFTANFSWTHSTIFCMSSLIYFSSKGKNCKKLDLDRVCGKFMEKLKLSRGNDIIDCNWT